MLTYNEEELTKELGIALSTLRTKFTRVQEKARRDGYDLTKLGRGKSAVYQLDFVKNDEMIAPTAASMFAEVRGEIEVEESWIGMEQMEFNLLLMLIMTPLKVFRGTYKEAATYMGLPVRERSYEKIKEGIEVLKEKELILDTIDEDVFIITLKRKVERNYLNFDSKLLNRCKEIGDELKMRSWVSVIKVWLAVRIIVAEKRIAVTATRMSELTGLSSSTIAKVLKKLAEENILVSERIVISELIGDSKVYRCLGRKIELNAFDEFN
ncbi:MAG: hypothetical protein RR744_08720 [Cellulosilyticaceae bacterium]